jgi:hypothetical protein
VKLIVVEGADGSGKTTLIRNLRQYSSQYFFVLNASGPPRNVVDLTGAVSLVGSHVYRSLRVICDRHPLISGPIYGPILRDQDLTIDLPWSKYAPPGEKTPTVRESIETELKRTVERIIYCRPPIDIILEHVKIEQQLEGVIEGVEKLVEAYDQSMKRLGKVLPVLRYDWTNPLESSPYDLVFGELK